MKMVKCIDKDVFNSLIVGEDYQVLEEFIVKIPINCKKKCPEEKREYKEVEMVKTNVGQFQKCRFDFLGLS